MTCHFWCTARSGVLHTNFCTFIITAPWKCTGGQLVTHFLHPSRSIIFSWTLRCSCTEETHVQGPYTDTANTIFLACRVHAGQQTRLHTQTLSLSLYTVISPWWLHHSPSFKCMDIRVCSRAGRSSCILKATGCGLLTLMTTSFPFFRIHGYQGVQQSQASSVHRSEQQGGSDESQELRSVAAGKALIIYKKLRRRLNNWVSEQ